MKRQNIFINKLIYFIFQISFMLIIKILQISNSAFINLFFAGF